MSLALGKRKCRDVTAWNAGSRLRRVTLSGMNRPTSAPLRLLASVATWLFALLVVFEEWGWVPLARLVGVVARLPGIAWVERRIAALPPRAAFGVLFVPMLLLLPFKIGALWLMAGGRMAVGVAVFLGAKLAGTGIVARLFMLTQPQLMRMAWFSRLYLRWLAWKDGMIARLRATPPWRLARAMLRRLRRGARRR